MSQEGAPRSRGHARFPRLGETLSVEAGEGPRRTRVNNVSGNQVSRVDRTLGDVAGLVTELNAVIKDTGSVELVAEDA